MPTPSQKNAQEIIKLQGEIKLIHSKITTIKDNHLAHLDKKVNAVFKILGVILTISIGSALNLIVKLLS